MSKKTSYFLGILLTIILGTILYYYLCCKSCYEDSNKTTEIETIVPEAPKIKDPTKHKFSIIDSKSGMSFKSIGNFNFKASSFSILNPVPEDLNSEVRKLTNYLNNNTNKAIDVTGLYTSTEKNNSAFPNLGLARANIVKNHLIKNGASSKSINIFGKINDSLVPNTKGIYFGPVAYLLKTIDTSDKSANDDLVVLKETIIANPLIMHFEIGNTSINLSPEQREKVAKISRYVDKTDNATIQIIGHTDSKGKRADNIILGQNRANGIKEYFKKNGISESKIKTSSKGPDQPIADNTTKEGQAKNRRVVVTIN
jgi:outer membrane protein OmpA-like peptidoglycan-associated protein